MADTSAFVSWFRESAPYIHAHRGRIFVLRFGGETVFGKHFVSLMHDVILLNALGIRLVLVHGNRPQLETRLEAAGAASIYHRNIRVTDFQAIELAKQAAGVVRVEVEAALTMGLANSPASGARTRVISGNYITAKPIGIRDGIDFGFAGEVRRIDRDAILQHLDDAVVVVSPLGFSPSGEVFNLHSEELATQIAVELGAAKLIVISEHGGLRDADGTLIRELDLISARERLRERREGHTPADSEFIRQLSAAIHACLNGVRRTHLIDHNTNGGLLLELFRRDGAGTMLSADAYDETRQATIEDVSGILALIEPLENRGVLVRRPRSKLETEIERFMVMERDGAIVACAAAYPIDASDAVELACLAVHPEYASGGRGDAMLRAVINQARSLGAGRLIALTTQTRQWFTERNFVLASVDDLPAERRKLYNLQRNSAVLIRQLTDL